MADPIPVLVAPSARDLTLDFLSAQLALRNRDAPWSTGIPNNRPSRFYVIEELNSATTYGVFADAQLVQVRAYDADRKWVGETARLIKAIWKTMPVWVHPTVPPPNGGLQAQDVEHAGGPTFDIDPNVPGLYYGQVIAWVTVMTEEV